MCDLWDREETREPLLARGIVEPNFIVCDDCGKKQHICDWPICWGKYGGHEPTIEYRPFVAWYDIALGAHIDSLATWNRVMKQKGWDLASKYDRDRPLPTPSTEGLDKAFAKAVRETHGGRISVGNLFRSDGSFIGGE